ncbi:hypothetical protein NTGZN8_60143 [Candidatus Nitrotoga fabula]|uniref:Uncharacterized protein n=1 Tax=Candidatus Nitrotoga fabula TaxID=2182327 RepID=A0A916FB55_9PROT|nr:hypothetical protein NTGZN8_60143 [Candidatus Nitrotoga fabula]
MENSTRPVIGVPDRNRTCNPQLRRLVLYPIELRAQFPEEPFDSVPLGYLVGVERFELPTSCSQSRRATRLRYTPKDLNHTLGEKKNQLAADSLSQKLHTFSFQRDLARNHGMKREKPVSLKAYSQDLPVICGNASLR